MYLIEVLAGFSIGLYFCKYQKTKSGNGKTWNAKTIKDGTQFNGRPLYLNIIWSPIGQKENITVLIKFHPKCRPIGRYNDLVLANAIANIYPQSPVIKKINNICIGLPNALKENQ